MSNLIQYPVRVYFLAQWQEQVQSDLDYPNPFGQLQNLSIQISKKVQTIKSLCSMYG